MPQSTISRKLLSLFIILLVIGGLVVWHLSSHEAVGLNTTFENFTQPIENTQDSMAKETDISETIYFRQTDKAGNPDNAGNVFSILLNVRSAKLDFKISLPLAHDLYEKNNTGQLRTEYTYKTFPEIISDHNSTLDGKTPFAAINADYIDPENQPQGYNVSRGYEYSGDFADQRSSLAISGDRSDQRTATIAIGPRRPELSNYNVVGGNGRFYTNGQFQDICQALGTYACQESTNRSMAAITSAGWLILLVYQEELEEKLLPSEFDDLLTKLAQNNDLGKIQDAILFDGGHSPGLMYNQTIYAQNGGPIGSALLVYLEE